MKSSQNPLSLRERELLSAGKERERGIFGEYIEFERRSQTAMRSITIVKGPFAAEIGVLGWLLGLFLPMALQATTAASNCPVSDTPDIYDCFDQPRSNV